MYPMNNINCVHRDRWSFEVEYADALLHHLILHFIAHYKRVSSRRNVCLLNAGNSIFVSFLLDQE